MEPSDEVRLTISRRQLKALILLALLSAGGYLMSETVTQVTYYPAPSGVYNQIATTGNAYFASDPAGKVGVGTTSPQFLMDINGTARVAQLFLSGIPVPEPPAGAQGLSWTALTIPGTPGAQTAVGYSNCNVWYTNSGADTCNGATTSGYGCRPDENRTCSDVFDQGCRWGVRSVYVWKCAAAVATQTLFALSASTVSVAVVPVKLVPVPSNRSIQSWNPVRLY